MKRRPTYLIEILILQLTAALAVLPGCGGGGEAVAPGGDTETSHFELGALQVGLASAEGFRTLTLASPETSALGFVALYGSKIVRLQEFGPGRIAFRSNRNGNDEVFAMNADGSGLANLTRNASWDGSPSWAPDGRKLAFVSNRNGNNEIYTMTAGGAAQTRLTSNAAEDFAPAWSPDGRKIAFQSDRDGEYEIWVMNADGTSPLNLTNHSAADTSPAWSPDGRKIAFASTRGGGSNFRLYTMNADGSGAAAVTGGVAGSDTAPAWCPDGQHLAFESTRDSDADIWVVSVSGGEPTKLTNNATADGQPFWSADGRRLVFQSSRDGNSEIYVMNADGTAQTGLTGNAADDGSPRWCPAPALARTLIGPAGSDAGNDPPFGTARPLAIVALSAEGPVSAATLVCAAEGWSAVQVAALDNLGFSLVGARITGTDLRRIDEDAGCGLPARQWNLAATPPTGAALVFFSAETGRVATVLLSADEVLPAAAAGALATPATRGLSLRGPFAAVYSVPRPGVNMAPAGARSVKLDPHNGAVVAVD